MAGLKYVPVTKPNSSRGWRNTVAIETVIELIEERFPRFEEELNQILKKKYDRIGLVNFSVRITYYSFGREEVVNAQ